MIVNLLQEHVPSFKLTTCMCWPLYREIILIPICTSNFLVSLSMDVTECAKARFLHLLNFLITYFVYTSPQLSASLILSLRR